MGKESIMAAAKKFLAKRTDEQEKKVTCNLGNGLTVELGLRELSQEMIERLALHGIAQKLGDATSSFSKTEDYHAAFGAMQTVADNLIAGVWASRGGAGVADLVTALAELQDLDVDDAQAAVDAMDEEQMKAVRSHPQVKLKIAEIQKRRLEAAAKTAPSLGELMAGLVKKD
jgi:hypothetical protein